MARLRVSNDPGDLSVKRLILNARGETNSSVGRGATRPTLGNPRSSPSLSLSVSLSLPPGFASRPRSNELLLLIDSIAFELTVLLTVSR